MQERGLSRNGLDATPTSDNDPELGREYFSALFGRFDQFTIGSTVSDVHYERLDLCFLSLSNHASTIICRANSFRDGQGGVFTPKRNAVKSRVLRSSVILFQSEIRSLACGCLTLFVREFHRAA